MKNTQTYLSTLSYTETHSTTMVVFLQQTVTLLIKILTKMLSSPVLELTEFVLQSSRPVTCLGIHNKANKEWLMWIHLSICH